MAESNRSSLALAIAAQREGKVAEAERHYRQWLGGTPDDATAWNDLGICLARQSKIDQAIEAFKQSIHRDARQVSAYRNLALAYDRKQDLDRAAEVYRAAIAIDPNSIDCLDLLGVVLARLGQMDDAVECFAHALKLQPKSTTIGFKLGKALIHAGKIQEGIDLLNQIVKLEPAHVEAIYEICLGLRTINQCVRALETVENLLSIKPDHVEALGTRALLLLSVGDYERGWREYEHRWNSKNFPNKKRTGPEPMWTGEELSGKTILIHAEQGNGDTIQFIRYAPLLARRGARVLCECPLDLLPILRGVEGIAAAFTPGNSPGAIDYHCPLLSLPYGFGTVMETVPAEVPYIRPTAALIEEWEARVAPYGKELKVGLVWAGSAKHVDDKRRSMTLADFAPLAELPIKLFTLQKGPTAAQAVTPPAALKLVNLTASISHFGDTAALIHHLDLVVTVDTAVAHLAGAMGKRVWTLLPFAPSWQWAPFVEKTPWYPTMRLYRQPTGGDWAGAVAKVVEDLRETTRALRNG